MQEYSYATTWIRIWAAILDGITLLPVVLIDIWIDSLDMPVVIALIWVSFTVVVWWLYRALLHWRFGQTIGKSICNIKVIGTQTDHLSIWQALLREVLYIGWQVFFLAYWLYVDNSENPTLGAGLANQLFVGLLILDVTTAFTNKKRRMLHDFIAKTTVVWT